MNRNIKSIKLISLFSGAGGLDLGFKQAGFDLLWANDFDADAVATYKHNIGDECVLGDIKDIDSNDIPNSDVIIGGFPCQGFSMANTKRNALDERNSLYLEYVRILKDKKPKIFIAENVKGILSLEKGEVLKAIIHDFESVGYQVQYKLLNSADYGVPQTRMRVIIVGIRNDLNINFEFPKPTHSKNPQKDNLLPWVSVKQALEHLPDPDGPLANTVPNNEYSQYKMVMNGYLGKRPLNPDLPAPTVTGRGDKKGGVVILPHPNGKRRMTVRELATVQDFPVNFEFIGNKTDCYRQIANAVPVGLAKEVAKSVLKVLGELK